MKTNTQKPDTRRTQMIAVTVVITIVALAAAATLVDVSRDGYRRIPTD